MSTPPRVFHVHFGEIPPRTVATAELVPATAGPRLRVLRPRVLYTCLDCGRSTASLDQMRRHQERQAEEHTLWQRLCRWVSILRE